MNRPILDRAIRSEQEELSERLSRVCALLCRDGDNLAQDGYNRAALLTERDNLRALIDVLRIQRQ